MEESLLVCFSNCTCLCLIIVGRFLSFDKLKNLIINDAIETKKVIAIENPYLGTCIAADFLSLSLSLDY
jgi:hypothetical protein